MKARYIRVSTSSQNTARQEKKDNSEIVFIDKISGSIPFNERPQAKELLKEIKKGNLNYLTISSIDRLGRNTLDVLTTINELHNLNTTVFVENLGLQSLNDGTENPTFKLIISVLANISEMEKNTMRERQLEGIAIAKLNGTYTGRQKGTRESTKEFLAKYPSVVSYLTKKTQYSLKEIAKISGCNINTVQKVKKVLKEYKSV